MNDKELKDLAYLAASICASYGGVSKVQAEHMGIDSFRKYPKAFFIDTLKIGMEIRGFGSKVEEFEEKMNDPRFDVLFSTDENFKWPEKEEIVSEADIPKNAVIEKEEEQS